MTPQLAGCQGSGRYDLSVENIDYWRFCDELTIVQAALLMVGVDPAGNAEYISDWEPHQRPNGYTAVSSALRHAVSSGTLKATIVRQDAPYGTISDDTDWVATRIAVSDLKEWVLKRGFKPDFFFPLGVETAEYLDRDNPQFSQKLAAAVEAWKAVSTERRRWNSGKSVKADLTKWLNLHAPDYGLTNEEGEPNKQAIEEVAKVANWNTKGGAPKTPGEPVADATDETIPPF